jgi:hypothetical protein
LAAGLPESGGFQTIYRWEIEKNVSLDGTAEKTHSFHGLMMIMFALS